METVHNSQTPLQYLLSSGINYREVDTRDNDIELQYSTNTESTLSSASDVTYIYDESLVPPVCDSFEMNSLENVSDLSDDTFVYNVSSNELGTENLNFSLEETFDTDSLETSSHIKDDTDGYDSSSNQDSDATYIYDTSSGSSRTANTNKVEYQAENESSKISIYYTNCDSVLNKRDELQLEIENCDPDVIVLTEIFPKSTD